MPHDFSRWNVTAVANTFCRLFTKKNHPYNQNPLTLDDFNVEYETIKEYINWHKENNPKYLIYNFTQENMNELFNLIKYQDATTEESEKIKKLWFEMCNVN